MEMDRLGRAQCFQDPRNLVEVMGNELVSPRGNAGRWLSRWATATLGQKHLTQGQSKVGVPHVIQGLGVARGKKNSGLARK